MWDGFFTLLFLCIVMATASFMAGSLPLWLSLSPRQLRLITALGTGVLVGTSLIVIIPEGVATLYDSAEGGHGGHKARSLISMPAWEAVNWKHDTWRPQLQTRETPLAEGMDMWSRTDTTTPPGDGKDFLTGPDDGHEDNEASDPSSSDSERPPSSHYNPHAWIGPSLILGFILMYLLDVLPRQVIAARSSQQPQRFHVSLNQFSFNRSASISDPEPSSAHPDNHPSSSSLSSGFSRSTSTTLGLVIHGTADGIALGASSTTAASRLSFVIFLALLIHKAPAAFGLTSVLLKQNLSKRSARGHLIIFSLSAPVGALLTWSTINLLGYGGSPESLSTEFATGVLLLFSGGTFIYVAMHTMQENGGSDEHGHGMENDHGGMNGHSYSGVPSSEMGIYDPQSALQQKARGAEGGQGLLETLVTAVGMFLPIFTTFGHSH